MVAPEVDHHEVLPGHVAGHAEHPGARLPLPLLLVEVVGGRVVGLGPVATRAEPVVLLVPLARVDVVAVGAAHAVRVHLALGEGVPLEVLVEVLPVGVERPRDEQRREVRVEELPSGAARSANCARRAWQGAHCAVISAGARRAVFATRPACSTGVRPMAGWSAQATWREPGPWQASQPTRISDQVVWYWSFSGS